MFGQAGYSNVAVFRSGANGKMFGGGIAGDSGSSRRVVVKQTPGAAWKGRLGRGSETGAGG